MIEMKLTEEEWGLVFRFHEAMTIVDTPTDFERACKFAHEVRNS